MDPEGYEEWKRENPEVYDEWLEKKLEEVENND